MSRLGGEVEGEVKDGMWDVEAKYRGGLVTNQKSNLCRMPTRADVIFSGIAIHCIKTGDKAIPRSYNFLERKKSTWHRQAAYI